MNRSIVSAILVVFIAACGGILGALNSWGGRIFITRAQTPSTMRVPASIHRHADISELDGSALKLAAQKHLLEDLKVLSEADRVGIQLGHFLTKNEAGNAAYACVVYHEVTLSFVGEGIADSGSKPVMEVSAPCVQARDSNLMEPVWIPLHELRGRTPSNEDITASTNLTHVKFQNIGTEWPSQWALEGVRLSTPDSDTALLVSGDEMRQFVKSPVVINW